MSAKLRVLSLGAGVQSTTLALMAAHGETPMPDCAIFCRHRVAYLTKIVKKCQISSKSFSSSGSTKQRRHDGKARIGIRDILVLIIHRPAHDPDPPSLVMGEVNATVVAINDPHLRCIS